MIRYLGKYPEAFDPETILVLGSALDDAWQRVQAGGTPFDGQAEAARSALAKHIVDVARQGERNRQRLVEGALARFHASR